MVGQGCSEGLGLEEAVRSHMELKKAARSAESQTTPPRGAASASCC